MTFGKFTGGRNRPFHSSVYAEVSNSGSIGATSLQSFGYRRHVERNRQAVGRYSDSFVAQRSNPLQEGLRRRLDSSESDDTDAERESRMHSRLQPPKLYGMRETSPDPGKAAPSSQKLQVPPRKTSFKEPPQRFNPYQ